jgi:hypothetical protein
MLNRDFQFARDGKNDDWLIIAGRKTYNFRSFESEIKKFLSDEGFEEYQAAFPKDELFYSVQNSKPSSVSKDEVSARDPSFSFRFSLRFFMAAVYGRTLYSCALSRLPGHVSERRVRARQRSLQRRLVSRLFGRTSLSTWAACWVAGGLPFGTSEYAAASIA